MESNSNNPDQKIMDNDRSYETTDQILHWFSFSKSMSNTKWILDLECIYRKAIKFSFGKFYKTEKQKKKNKKKKKKKEAQLGLISPTLVFATTYKRVKWMVHGRNLHLMINDGLKIQMCFFRILKLFLSFFPILSLVFLKV